MKDIETIIEAINAHSDLTATARGDEIRVTVYGKPAGSITEQDAMEAAGGCTSTGWPRSKRLRKGALKVLQAIQSA